MNQNEFNNAETESKLRMELIAQQEKYKTGWPLGDPREFFNQPQREWVGLTRDEILQARWHNKSSYKFARVLEDMLKERNT
jgi:hypothetical protein